MLSPLLTSDLWRNQKLHVKTSFQHGSMFWWREHWTTLIKIKYIIKEGKSFNFTRNYSDDTWIISNLQYNIGLYWFDIKNKVQFCNWALHITIVPRTNMHHSSISIQTHLRTCGYKIIFSFSIRSNVLTGYTNQNSAFLEKASVVNG